MITTEYPTSTKDRGRQGLVRVYYEEPKDNFVFLIPNYRLPQGPLYISEREVSQNQKICQGLEELLQLCLHRKAFCTLRWDNIYLDTYPWSLIDEPVFLRVRSLSPQVTKQHPGIGIAGEALSQWASVMGNKQQVEWLRNRIDSLMVPHSLGSEDAEIITLNRDSSLDRRLAVFDDSKVQEPSVCLTSFEKEYILYCLQEREILLEKLDTYASCLSNNSSIAAYFDEKKALFLSLYNSRKERKALISRYSDKTQPRVSDAMLKHCIQWLKELVDTSSGKNSLQKSLQLCKHLASAQGTCVLEPGIESWYCSVSQKNELRLLSKFFVKQELLTLLLELKNQENLLS
ncbi:hypothetical protein [Chlamydia sp. 17-3921]|uniref:hypothetical protein n=1 Tax=Chlamydia sp. 17-3921 TaxID=2675798 RepID=UPI00191B53D5|nr:hypothetical protein [Chlamydia sp. 17-3921]